MSPTALEALTSLALVGVPVGSVRAMSPRGSLAVVAFCVRRGVPHYGEGADLQQALTRLATKVGYVAGLERAEARMQAVGA